jgi:hypothetical protein
LKDENYIYFRDNSKMLFLLNTTGCQAGQWVYSPSGLPISILTGKFAAYKALANP